MWPATMVQQLDRVLPQDFTAEPRAHLDYAEVRDAENFLRLEELHPPAMLLIAAKVGPTRLIDNFLVRADGSWDIGISINKHEANR